MATLVPGGRRLGAEPAGQRAEEGLQGDRAVGDGAAELGGRGRLLVDVQRVVVAGDVGVAVDRLLADRFGDAGELGCASLPLLSRPGGPHDRLAAGQGPLSLGVVDREQDDHIRAVAAHVLVADRDLDLDLAADRQRRAELELVLGEDAAVGDSAERAAERLQEQQPGRRRGAPRSPRRPRRSVPPASRRTRRRPSR